MTTINDLLHALYDELEAGDVPTPLRQAFPLATIWLDLCRLAGEEPPADVVAAVLGETVELVPLVGPSYLAHHVARHHA